MSSKSLLIAPLPERFALAPSSPTQRNAYGVGLLSLSNRASLTGAETEATVPTIGHVSSFCESKKALATGRNAEAAADENSAAACITSYGSPV